MILNRGGRQVHDFRRLGSSPAATEWRGSTRGPACTHRCPRLGPRRPVADWPREAIGVVVALPATAVLQRLRCLENGAAGTTREGELDGVANESGGAMGGGDNSVVGAWPAGNGGPGVHALLVHVRASRKERVSQREWGAQARFSPSLQGRGACGSTLSDGGA